MAPGAVAEGLPAEPAEMSIWVNREEADWGSRDMELLSKGSFVRVLNNLILTSPRRDCNRPFFLPVSTLKFAAAAARSNFKPPGTKNSGNSGNIGEH